MAVKVPKDLVKQFSREHTEADLFNLKEKYPDLWQEWMEERANRGAETSRKLYERKEEIQKQQFDPGWLALEYGGLTTPLLRNIPGVSRAVDLAESGATTAPTKKYPQGRLVMEKVRNWFKGEYKGKLWENPEAGFPESGAYARFYRMKKQAPGTGIKVSYGEGGLAGEQRFIESLADKTGKTVEEARQLFNADKVLQEYLPRWETVPGKKFLHTEAMNPMGWSEVKYLPIAEQRKMFINFAHHVRRLGRRLEKYEMYLGDTHTDNWGITREGKPLFWDLGESFVDSPGAGTSTAEGLLLRSTPEFSPGAYPPGEQFDVAAAMQRQLKKGGIGKKELGSPDFWDKAADRFRKADTGKAKDVVKQLGEDVIADPGTPSKGLMEAAARGTSVDTMDISRWPDGQLVRRLRTVERMNKRQDTLGMFTERIETLKRELDLRGMGSDIAKEISR